MPGKYPRVKTFGILLNAYFDAVLRQPAMCQKIQMIPGVIEKHILPHLRRPYSAPILNFTALSDIEPWSRELAVRVRVVSSGLLREWIAKERSGMYDILPGPKILVVCNLCGSKFNANQSTSSHFIEFVHEKSIKHQDALADSQQQVAGAARGELRLVVGEQVQPSPRQQLRACQGITLVRGDPTYRISAVEDSARRWLQAGSPDFKSFQGEDTEKQNCMWAVSNDAVVLKSRMCLGGTVSSGQACAECVKLGNSRKVSLGEPVILPQSSTFSPFCSLVCKASLRAPICAKHPVASFPFYGFVCAWHC